MVKRLMISIFATLILVACTTEGPISIDRENSETADEAVAPTTPPEETETAEAAEDADIEIAITDDIVTSQFLNISEPFDTQFEQDAITVGMNQEMIERMYGPYDFVLMESSGMKVIYENIAVTYIHGNPSGDGLLGDPSIDPVTNVVTEVFYFANVSRDDVIDVFGQPDDMVDYGDSPHMNYYQTDEEGNQYTVRAEMSQEGGDYIVNIIKRMLPDGSYRLHEDGENTVTLNQLDALINAFMEDYEAYHQTRNDAVFEHVREGSIAMRNIQSVRYDNYELNDVVVNYKFEHGDGTVTVNANVFFDHDDLANRRNATMIFTVDPSSMKIIDFSAFQSREY